MAAGTAAVGLTARVVLDAEPPREVAGALEVWEPLLGPAVTRPLDGRAYVQLAFFSWAPLLVAVYSVIASSAAATVTRNETVPLLLRILNDTARLSVIASIAFAITLPFGLLDEVAAERLVLAPLALVPLGLACAGLGFVIAILTRNRGLAIAIVGAETLIVLALNVAADLDQSVSWLRYLSPFHYADVKTAFLEGVVGWHVALLLVAAVGQTALGMGLLARRSGRA
jgi:hypothetical protein